MRTVTRERSATTAPSDVFHSVALDPAPRVLNAMPGTTASTAAAFLPCKEMASASVKGVSCHCSSRLSSDYSLLAFPCLVAVTIEDPECRIDQDCPQQMSCVEEHCQNLCQSRNPCQGNLECSITESYDGSRTVACSCPDGFVAVSASHCEQGS